MPQYLGPGTRKGSKSIHNGRKSEGAVEDKDPSEKYNREVMGEGSVGQKISRAQNHPHW